MCIIVFFLCGEIIYSFKRFFALSRYREYSFGAKKTLSASKCDSPPRPYFYSANSHAPSAATAPSAAAVVS